MGPKKDKGKGPDPGKEGGDPGESPFTLLNNYQKFCRCLLGSNDFVRRVLFCLSP